MSLQFSNIENYTHYAVTFDLVNGVAPSEAVVDFVMDNIHRVEPFEDDWYGNDEMDLNACTIGHEIFFVVYEVVNGSTNINNALSHGKIRRRN